MSHTNETTYYQLPQFIGTDIINPLTDTNGAYSAIDTALHDVAAVAGQAETVAGQASDDVQTMDGRVTALESGIQTTDGNVENISKAIAPTFVTTASYTSGDYVMYNGKRYRFTATHVAGSWSGTDAVEAPCNTEDKRAFSALNSITSQLDGKIIRGQELIKTVTADGSKTRRTALIEGLNFILSAYKNRAANVKDVIIDGVTAVFSATGALIPVNMSIESVVTFGVPVDFHTTSYESGGSPIVINQYIFQAHTFYNSTTELFESGNMYGVQIKANYNASAFEAASMFAADYGSQVLTGAMAFAYHLEYEYDA